MGHLNNMLQLAWLLFNLCCQEKGSRGNHISVEASEGLDHVEAMHVYDGSVDGELGYIEPLSHVL